MSDVRMKPQTGQWYDTLAYGRVFFIGWDFDQRGAFRCERFLTFTASEEDFSTWVHLPECTDWRWKPEQFPQYFRGDRWRDSDAYVRFDSADKCGMVVFSDGSEFECVHYVFADVEECIRRHKWRRLTRAEAEARVKKPEPVESPEDWVVQDRVPPREHIDQVSYTIDDEHWNVAGGKWSSIHGADFGSAGKLQVRCRRKDLPPLPVQSTDGQWGVEPAREALEKIAAQYNIDGKNLKSAELGEKISLAMLKVQISELRDQVATINRRLEKLDKTPVPDVFTTVVKNKEGEYRFIPPGPHTEPEPGRYNLNDDEVIEKGDRFFVKHCGWFFCNHSVGKTRRKFLSDNPQFIGTIGPVTRSFS